MLGQLGELDALLKYPKYGGSRSSAIEAHNEAFGKAPIAAPAAGQDLQLAQDLVGAFRQWGTRWCQASVLLDEGV